MKPLISIIMPVYNKEIFLRETLDSVCQQTYDKWELIIIDDGSTDQSYSISREYVFRDPRISVHHIENNGVSNARNIGLSKAKGKWIQFLDGDDTIDVDYLSTVMQNPAVENYDIIFTNFYMIDRQNEIIDSISINNNIYELTNEMLLDLFIQYQYKNGFFGFISNKLIKRSLIINNNILFSKDVSLAEDLQFYVKIYNIVQKAYYLPINSFYYMQNNESYNYRNRIDYYSQLMIHKEIKDLYIEKNKYYEYSILLDKNITKYIFFCIFYEYEYTKQISEIYYKIKNNNEIYDSIILNDIHGFEKIIITCVKNDYYFLVKFLLASRFYLRKLYRGIRNGKNSSV